MTLSARNGQLGAGNWAELPPGDYVQLCVTDTGTGIAPDVLEGHGALLHHEGAGQGQRPWPQHGLRLRQAVERGIPHSQRAWEGNDGGAWLPRAPEGAQGASTPSKEEPRRKSTRKLRILLVDDHAEVGAQRQPFWLGHASVEAANGAEAMKVLQDGDCNYDVMISDYAMPHLSGTDFLRGAESYARTCRA